MPKYLRRPAIEGTTTANVKLENAVARKQCDMMPNSVTIEEA